MDFEFLSEMLLLQNMNGSSCFYKGPRTLWVLGLLNFTSPWTFAKTTTPIHISWYCTIPDQNSKSYWYFLKVPKVNSVCLDQHSKSESVSFIEKIRPNSTMNRDNILNRFNTRCGLKFIFQYFED